MIFAPTAANADSYDLNSTTGHIHLHISHDGDVTGEYPSMDGQIFGHEDRDGDIDGIWVRPTSDRECSERRHGSYYWGRVKIIHPREHHFEGWWGRCHDTPDNDWGLRLEHDD